MKADADADTDDRVCGGTGGSSSRVGNSTNFRSSNNTGAGCDGGVGTVACGSEDEDSTATGVNIVVAVALATAAVMMVERSASGDKVAVL